jgi:hypothetical protein
MHADKFPAEFAALQKACGGDGIVLLDQVLDRSALQRLLDRCDAYVCLHRSEGFGFPMYEAMAAGKPVIATDYSGNIDFMAAHNSCPVDFTLVGIEREQGPYRKGTPWAQADVEQAAACMRRLVAERDGKLGTAARADVQRYLSEARIGTLIRDRLVHAESQRPRRKLPPEAGPETTSGPQSFHPLRQLVHRHTDTLRRQVERLAASHAALAEDLVCANLQRQRQARRVVEWLERSPPHCPPDVHVMTDEPERFPGLPRVSVDRPTERLLVAADVLRPRRPIEVWQLLESLDASSVVLEWDANRAALVAESRSLDCRGAWPHTDAALQAMLTASGFSDVRQERGFLTATR